MFIIIFPVKITINRGGISYFRYTSISYYIVDCKFINPIVIYVIFHHETPTNP